MHRTIEELVATLSNFDIANPNISTAFAKRKAHEWFASLTSEDRAYLLQEWHKGEYGALDRDSRLCEFMFFLY